ncbi:MAG: 16S rRNA (cytosine(967)-C(5))-methyltransferase RsmB [Gammaproteobacteria bacterium]|nr:16S rRNA (cytosine(967)-C(5))-methyltransferase RsmB [Gammaproteobacteria bacterium]MBT8150145.1 16S rRNA (cytosine(967)-C(5))-methyltransferase RsmB [Gammaproteobacteria bacterium]NNM11238.1 16S rRNA (cytosine(967)-C(5))-methyltransferase RsmB [Pseudomonadales bacterium]
MQNVRALAASSLAAVIADGRPFDGSIDMPRARANKRGATQKAVLPDQSQLNPRDLALFRELCYGSLRRYALLEVMLGSRLKKPLGKRDADIHALLLIGLYQLVFLRTPDHAALSATVNACIALQKTWAKGLVNAVLRNCLRDLEQGDRKQIPRPAQASEAALASHPQWLYQRLKADWPQHWQQIIEYNNSPPHMALRVDIARQPRADYQHTLQAAGLASQTSEVCDSALLLEHACDPTTLPGFDEGLCSVQDSGAQLAAALLHAGEGASVLDACAAPGGKTLHILQHCQPKSLCALDLDAGRLARVHENLKRCSRSGVAKLEVADASDTGSWWRGQPFDRILLDAPCSGSGVIARHPDIKLLRREADIAKLAGAQLNLLTALWITLADDGELLYCSCSVLREENERVIATFLDNEAGASALPIDAQWGIACGAGRQLLPKKASNDGFFYARLRKSPLR